ncbi:hypothetical protein MCEMIH15_01902 [Caulobacteraceae bacterium]
MVADGYIRIQADYGNGSWRTLNTVMNNSQYIAHAMKSVAKMHPKKRVRAVDSDGRLVDML